MNSIMDYIFAHHSAFSILIAFILDCLLGDPHCFPHPVRFMGFLISFLEKHLNMPEDSKRIKKLKGGFLVLSLITTSFFIPFGILFIAKKIHPALFLAIESIMCYQCLAARSLFSESMKVWKELKNKDIEKARKAVSMIVGRDTDILDEKGIAKAAVETVAESTSDGVIAPLFYMALFGPAGAFVYKAINTMDSMIAYKNKRFEDFGFIAAKSDDVANLIPSRICALIMILTTALLSPLPLKERFRPVNAARIFIRDRYKHASPNSAQTESVCAGALGLQLAGDTVYAGITEKKEFIGDKLKEINAGDIIKANVLMYGTTIMSVALAVFIRI